MRSAMVTFLPYFLPYQSDKADTGDSVVGWWGTQSGMTFSLLLKELHTTPYQKGYTGLFIIAKKQKPKCSSTDEWTNKM